MLPVKEDTQGRFYINNKSL